MSASWCRRRSAYPTAIAAYVVHIYSSYKIIDIGIEYVILEGLELLATNVHFDVKSI